MFHVREIKQDDLEDILNLFLDTYSGKPWNESWDFEIARKKIDDLFKCNISQNYCIENNHGEICGALFSRRNYYLSEKEFFIDEFFIAKNYQHQGVGSYFLNAVIEIIKQSGYSCMVLNTAKDYPSEFFYRKNGFLQLDTNIFMYKTF